MAKAESRYTQATRLAQDDMRKVIDTFAEDTPFMSDGASDRTQARKDRIAASPEAQALLGRYPDTLIDRIIRGSG